MLIVGIVVELATCARSGVGDSDDFFVETEVDAGDTGRRGIARVSS